MEIIENLNGGYIIALFMICIMLGCVISLYLIPKHISKGNLAGIKSGVNIGKSFLAVIDRDPKKKNLVELIFTYLEGVIHVAENSGKLELESVTSGIPLSEVKHKFVREYIMKCLEDEGVTLDKNLEKLVDACISFTVQYTMK